MGRSSKVDKAQLVDFDKIENVSRCLLCDKTLKGYLLGNIKRHYVTIHKHNFDDEPMELKTNEESMTSDVPKERSNKPLLSIKYHVSEESMPVKPDLSSIKQQDLCLRPHENTLRNKSDISVRKMPDAPDLTHKARKRRAVEAQELQSTYETVKPTVSKKIGRDHSDVFGEHVAAKHRKYSYHVKSVVEHLISQILFEADMGKHDDPPRHLLRKRTAPIENLNNPFADSDQEEQQTTVLHDLKASRSSSVSSESEMLNNSELY